MILPGGCGAERAPPVVAVSAIRHAAVRTHAGPVRGTGRGVWAGRLHPAPGITVISLFCPVSARFPNAEYLPSRYGSGAWEGPAHRPRCPDLVLRHLCVGLRCLAMGVCSSWPTRAVPKGDCLCPPSMGDVSGLVAVWQEGRDEGRREGLGKTRAGDGCALSVTVLGRIGHSRFCPQPSLPRWPVVAVSLTATLINRGSAVRRGVCCVCTGDPCAPRKPCTPAVVFLWPS